MKIVVNLALRKFFTKSRLCGPHPEPVTAPGLPLPAGGWPVLGKFPGPEQKKQAPEDPPGSVFAKNFFRMLGVKSPLECRAGTARHNSAKFSLLEKETGKIKLHGPLTLAEHLPGRCRGLLQVGRRMGLGEEPGLELRRRQINPLSQHPLEKLAEAG